MSPYQNKDVSNWQDITITLIEKHPLRENIVEYVLKSWESILNGKINTYLNLFIRQMSISPQATGALLHDIIPEYIQKNTNEFRKGIGNEKDIVCISNDIYSTELKTSSQKSIYGNRSYTKSEGGKSKSGYYLAVNFDKICKTAPKIQQIRFGWLDHNDWVGQKSQTGQRLLCQKIRKKAN
jgi:ScaI restriction endonuclease